MSGASLSGQTTCGQERMDSRCNKVIEPSESTTLSDVSEYHTAEGASYGPNSQDTRPSCSSELGYSSSSEYLPAHDDVQSITSCSESNSGLERQIEASKVHWSELSSNADSDDEPESNREIYERLRRLPQYQHWLNVEDDLLSINNIVLGKKLAEGGQAEIFEVSHCQKKKDHENYVLKVYKKGYSLRGLQTQWPKGVLSARRQSDLVPGGLVLEDDRFAFLIRRRHFDQRDLIDKFREDNFSSMREERITWTSEELKPSEIYEPDARRKGLTARIFREGCALRIMCCIALQMLSLHDENILHRDLKASNILCLDYQNYDGRSFFVDLADFESSMGVVGTGFWRAPEILQQLKERKQRIHFTHKADVYSYAMTCYEILSGYIPFEGYRSGDYEHVLNGLRPTLPNHVPTWLMELLHKCWHPDASMRPTFRVILEEFDSHGIPSFNPFIQIISLERPVKNGKPFKHDPGILHRILQKF